MGVSGTIPVCGSFGQYPAKRCGAEFSLFTTNDSNVAEFFGVAADHDGSGTGCVADVAALWLVRSALVWKAK